MAKSAGLDVKISDPNIWVNQVQGPLSLKILDAACDENISESLRYFDIATVTIAGQKLVITRTGFTSEIGWEYYVSSKTDCILLWMHLMAVGKTFGLIHSGLDSMDIRRIEAGIMNSGSDFDLTMNPYAAGLGRFVDLEKADFFGKDALKSAKKDKIVMGLRCKTSEPMVLSEVIANNTHAGVISAASWSPFLNCGIGYKGNQSGHKSGEIIEIHGVDGNVHEAELVELLFIES